MAFNLVVNFLLRAGIRLFVVAFEYPDDWIHFWKWNFRAPFVIVYFSLYCERVNYRCHALLGNWHSGWSGWVFFIIIVDLATDGWFLKSVLKNLLSNSSHFFEILRIRHLRFRCLHLHLIFVILIISFEPVFGINIRERIKTLDDLLAAAITTNFIN